MGDVIITGVDGSQTASEAARAAARLAQALGGELRLVCAYDKLAMESVESDGREYVFSTEEAALGLAEETLRSLRKEFADLDGVAVAALGKPADALLAVAEESSATLIVVGNKRVQGAVRLLGSIATDIAQKAHCDVYIAYTHVRD